MKKSKAYGLYTIYDRVAGQYAMPFAAASDGVADREFVKSVAPTGMMDDFHLVKIGNWYPETSSIDHISLNGEVIHWDVRKDRVFVESEVIQLGVKVKEEGSARE